MRRSKVDIEIEKSFTENRRGYRSIARRAGEQDCDDVVQEAYLKVVSAARREVIEKPTHLLARVVRTVAIDKLRRLKRRPELAAFEDERAADPLADPERRLIGAERLRRAMSVIQAMPTRRRQVFLLHRVEELSYPQIAAKLGVSVKSVEKHISLALKQLIEFDQ